MTMKVGFIGLGIMGKPMSKNLLKAGYSLVVSDRNPEAIADVITAGAVVMEMMQALRADGLGTADHSALACYYEKLAKVEVTRE
ncbi:tartronate semialdehyde reductase [Escherichia marmotae]|uniref:Tartronate semialdehyde reductase n=1 Tax=Escherichia marmotae TaxID=1499973 RepID=A0A7Z8ZS65_9ESCH|nr:hypothetical protein [Escherichia coli]VED81586.1 tartronate semialdehyde reductase [Escherichia marmotae]